MVNKKRARTEHSSDSTTTTPPSKRARIERPDSDNRQSSSSAAARCFYNTELLEQILKHQSIEDLISVRLVCHKWNDVILGSVSLRRIMFLAPPERIIEPSPIKYTANRFLLKPKPSRLRGRVRSIIPFAMDHIKPGFLRSKSFFLDMFATKPPLSEVVLLQHAHFPCEHLHAAQRERVRNSKGVKVKDVLRAGDRMFGFRGWHRRYLDVTPSAVWANDRAEGQ